MFSKTKRPLVAVAATCALALGVSAAPASAQQSGLVNVDLTGNTVQVPVAVAANICGVQANVIAAGNFGGNAICDSASRSRARNGGGGSGSKTRQQGLVNVAVVDNTIQVPIGIAANVCGVQANVIAANNFGGNALCDAATRADASA